MPHSSLATPEEDQFNIVQGGWPMLITHMFLTLKLRLIYWTSDLVVRINDRWTIVDIY